MAGLGNIFADEDPDEAEAGGLDLRVSAEVPRAALGHGLRVRIPRRLAADGDLVERAIDEDDPDRVLVHLPEALPSGAVLRLRGQGGVAVEGGRPGDLFIVVDLVDRPAEPDELVVESRTLVASGTGAEDGLVAVRDLTWPILGVLALLAAAAVAFFTL